MERVTDYALLWRQLVEASHWPQSRSEGEWSREADPWKERARRYAERVRRKGARPDPIREFVASRVAEGETVLDVGAGTGSWSMLLARKARKVTAVEPSPAMREVLEEELAAEGIGNVEVVGGFWPGVEVEPHDHVLSAHAMYGSADLPGFVRARMRVANRSCYLLMRVPSVDGVMAEAARHVWGHMHDSPNFLVGLGVLHQMGIVPSVLVDPSPWEPWASPSLDDALADIKRRLVLETSQHDEFLRDLLARRLVYRDGRYVWPPATTSALAYWDVAPR